MSPRTHNTERAGFALLAAEHGYTIVPVSSVGMEDVFSIWFDLPVSWFFDLVGPKPRDVTAPVLAPWHFRPQRNYFKFGKPIPTDHLRPKNGESLTKEDVWAVREQTRKAVEEGVQELLERREKDNLRYFGSAQWRPRFMRWWNSRRGTAVDEADVVALSSDKTD